MFRVEQGQLDCPSITSRASASACVAWRRGWDNRCDAPHEHHPGPRGEWHTRAATRIRIRSQSRNTAHNSAAHRQSGCRDEPTTSNTRRRSPGQSNAVVRFEGGCPDWLRADRRLGSPALRALRPPRDLDVGSCYLWRCFACLRHHLTDSAPDCPASLDSRDQPSALLVLSLTRNEPVRSGVRLQLCPRRCDAPYDSASSVSRTYETV